MKSTNYLFKLILQFFICLFFLSVHNVKAQNRAKDYQHFTLGAHFSPNPLKGSGKSGGNKNVAELFPDSNCASMGRIDETPDHVLNVKSIVNIEILAESHTGDVSIILIDPKKNSLACDDNSAGNLNARLLLKLHPGQYYLYVGSSGQSTLRTRYELTITEK